MGLKQKSGLMLIAAAMVLLVCLSAGASADEPVRIMPLGDSITRGWYGSVGSNGYRKPLYLNLAGRGYNVDFVGGMNDGDFADRNHEGHDGWHAAGGTGGGLLPNVYNWLVVHPADIVLLHIGTNDITYNDQDVNEVSGILDEIDRFSEDITVILALIINRQSYSAATTQFNDELNAMALNRIAGGDDIIIVDMESALNYSTDMVDNLHPNDAGYAKMADVWYDVLDSILAVPPTIVSAPVRDGTVTQPYIYDVEAHGYPNPNYTLVTHPDGMTINPGTGRIEWVPPSAGDFEVTVAASNGSVPDADQSFTVVVSTAIKFDASSFNSSSTDGPVLSWPHSIGSGNDRMLVIGVAAEDDSAADLAISSVTYNGINMNLIENSGSTAGTAVLQKTELYYLQEDGLPSAGTYNVVVTYSGNVGYKCGGAVSLENVEQQLPEAVAAGAAENANTISTNITTLAEGAWVVDVVGCGSQGSFSPTVIGGMVERFDVQSGSSASAGGTKLVISPEQTNIGWNFSGSSSAIAHSLAAFAPTRPAISGYILGPNDVPVEGVSVSSADPNVASDTTDPNGYYEVSVPYGWSGSVEAAKTNCLFRPAQQTYSNVIAKKSGQDYDDITVYDLNTDGSIDWGDIAVIAENWLGSGEGDLHSDGVVNFLDFAEFTRVW